MPSPSNSPGAGRPAGRPPGTRRPSCHAVAQHGHEASQNTGGAGARLGRLRFKARPLRRTREARRAHGRCPRAPAPSSRPAASRRRRQRALMDGCLGYPVYSVVARRSAPAGRPARLPVPVRSRWKAARPRAATLACSPRCPTAPGEPSQSHARVLG
jgi:hypothetical protein